VLPLRDLVEPLDLDDADRGREFVHAEVQTVHAEVGLAVVPERARVLDDVGVPRDDGTALAGGDRFRCREGPDARVAPGPRAAAVPARPMCVTAVLDQENPLSSTKLGDSLDVEGAVAADVHE